MAMELHVFEACLLALSDRIQAGDSAPQKDYPANSQNDSHGKLCHNGLSIDTLRPKNHFCAVLQHTYNMHGFLYTTKRETRINTVLFPDRHNQHLLLYSATCTSLSIQSVGKLGNLREHHIIDGALF